MKLIDTVAVWAADSAVAEPAVVDRSAPTARPHCLGCIVDFRHTPSMSASDRSSARPVYTAR